MQAQLTAVYRRVPEGYIGFVEELPGANIQAATLRQARSELVAAVRLVLESNRVLARQGTDGPDWIREPLAWPHDRDPDA